MGLLPGSYADLGGVVLVLAFLAFFTGCAFAATKDGSGLGRVVPRVVVLAFDVVCLVITVAHYGDGVWFPSD